jgi:type IV secretory pathway TrbL component
VIPVDVDRDGARDAAQSELGKPIYPSASLWDRIIGWFEELLYRIMVEGSQVPGGWFTITILIVLLAAAVVLAVRVAMRTMRTNRGADAALFGSVEMSSAQHRAAAEQAAAQGDWALAIRHRLRAVARHLEETAVLHPVPGRTATELARDAGAVIPGLSGELRRAADAFNDVTYGEQPGTEAQYRVVAELDDHLRTRGRAASDAVTSDGAHGDWAEVR